MTLKLNSGQIAAIIGEWYRDEYGYAEGVEEFHRWADEQREDAHIEALEGQIAQLQLREDYLEAAGGDNYAFIRGFRSARLRVAHATETLLALYSNRRRFAARDRAKAAAERALDGLE